MENLLCCDWADSFVQSAFRAARLFKSLLSFRRLEQHFGSVDFGLFNLTGGRDSHQKVALFIEETFFVKLYFYKKVRLLKLNIAFELLLEICIKKLLKIVKMKTFLTVFR